MVREGAPASREDTEVCVVADEQRSRDGLTDSRLLALDVAERERLFRLAFDRAPGGAELPPERPPCEGERD